MDGPIYTIPPTIDHVGVDVLDTTPWTRPPEVMQPVWGAGITGKDVVILNLDTGYTPHRLLPKPLESRNFTSSNKTDVTDRHSHGNHCIGSNLGREGLSAAPEASLKVGKVLGDSGGGSNTTAGLRWALETGCDIVSCSWGSNTSRVDASTTKALQDLEEAGIWVVFAAGNEGYRGWDTVGSPASSPHCVCVSSIDQNGQPSSFSSGGARIDVAAGGGRILSCGLRNDLALKSGTSMSCPTKASDLALLRQAMRRLGMNVYMTSRELVAFLKSEEFLKDAGAVGRDPRYGEGIGITSQNIINWILKNATEFA